MKRFLKVIVGVTLDDIANILMFIENNLKNFANILNMVLPYLMYFVGQEVFKSRGNFGVGGEIFIPLVFGIIIYYIRSFANKIGKGITIPVPDERFTEVDEDGEVNVRNSRLQEMILYLADLEDWLERKGLL